ncbi:hypothetical protein RRG08_002541 [Elysia crispata]|uniref:Uncharacterized protein n=1 Tax=Elysia crispata TaxID=231223 RepID=A0AAE0Y4J1_9GAST|nr:hypothetical protein RRG08_002541 [Elysia crispata]
MQRYWLLAEDILDRPIWCQVLSEMKLSLESVSTSNWIGCRNRKICGVRGLLADPLILQRRHVAVAKHKLTRVCVPSHLLQCRCCGPF